jgi:RIO-like serine/threonine protein kinase
MPEGEPPQTVEDVERGTLSLLGKQGPFRPSVRLLEHGGRSWVAKDYRACTPLYRWTVGAWNLRRERAALERLRDVEGVPHVEAMAGRWILVLTHFRGRDIGKADKARQDARFFDSLRRIVTAMHERGVVHLDLRQRRNILIQPDGSAAVIDFGAALCLSRGGRLLRRLARIDDSGVLKYKQRAQPGSLSAEETDRLERAERRRSLWPFS